MPILLVSTYLSHDQRYAFAAVRGVGPRAAREELEASCADSSDQAVCLAILRSIAEDRRVATRGALFVGGHILDAPYAFAYARGRLLVNGLSLPDVMPPRTPNPNAELETRRAIVAALMGYRDSLRASGVEWSRAVERLRSRAGCYPLIEKTLPIRQGGPFEIRWKWGYAVQGFGRATGGYSLGELGAFEATEAAVVARMEYLQRLLDEDRTVFLLGGGAEWVASPEAAQTARQVALRIGDSDGTRTEDRALLPAEVVEQLEHPLTLERVP